MFAIYFGIRGGGEFFIFGGLDHGREFSQGFAVPFYRSQGIQRSYGEFGIFLSAAWSYYLLFRKNHNIIIRTISGIILLLAIIISQSRTSWLAIFLITITFLCIKIGAKKFIISFILVLVFLLPLVTGLVSTVGRELPGVKQLIGEHVHQANVDGRHDLDVLAIGLFFKKPLKMFWGISHAEWFYIFPQNYERASGHLIAGLHNHFLSNLVYLGLIPGLLNIMIIFIPAIRLINLQDYQNKDIFIVILATIGLITCLHFYEGFFSPITCVILATLWYAAYRSNPENLPPRHSKPS